MSASSRIRASIEALPEHQRTDWITDDGFVATAPSMANVCETWEDEPRPTAAYIALMGPHVGEKVAALLEAHQRIHEVMLDVEPTQVSALRRAMKVGHAWVAANKAARELEAAIEGGQR